MRIPVWAIVLNCLLIVLLAGWAFLLSTDRNPLPWPDPGSRIFAASSPEAKSAIVDLLANHGLTERFEIDSSGIQRSVMWDGTIINHSPAEVTGKLGGAGSAIGLVSDDPRKDAEAAARFLRSRGFKADVVLDAEPNLPIAFVVTDAMLGTALNFRPPVSQMPAPE